MIWNTFPLWNSVKFLQFTVDSKGITSFHKIFRGKILLPLECKFWFVNILLPFLRDGRSWRYLCLNPCLIFINPALSPSHAYGRPLSWRSLAIASDLSLPLRFCSEKWTSCQAWPGARTAVWGETPPHRPPPSPFRPPPSLPTPDTGQWCPRSFQGGPPPQPPSDGWVTASTRKSCHCGSAPFLVERRLVRGHHKRDTRLVSYFMYRYSSVRSCVFFMCVHHA